MKPLGIFTKFGLLGRVIGKAIEVLSYGKIIKTGTSVSTSCPFSLSTYLFQLPVTNAANVYVQQINKWLNIWAPSPARLCAENGITELGSLSSGGNHINEYVLYNTLGWHLGLEYWCKGDIINYTVGDWGRQIWLIPQEDKFTRKLCSTNTVPEIHIACLMGEVLLSLHLLSSCPAQRAAVVCLPSCGSSTALWYSGAAVRGALGAGLSSALSSELTWDKSLHC